MKNRIYEDLGDGSREWIISLHMGSFDIPVLLGKVFMSFLHFMNSMSYLFCANIFLNVRP